MYKGEGYEITQESQTQIPEGLEKHFKGLDDYIDELSEKEEQSSTISQITKTKILVEELLDSIYPVFFINPIDNEAIENTNHNDLLSIINKLERKKNK